MSDKLFLFDEFINELNESESPGHLDQLELFYEDTDELFGSLTEIISSSQIAVTYATANKNACQKLKKEEPVGFLLHWPSPDSGLCSIIHSEREGSCNSFVAVFPFLNEGSSFSCRVTETRLFSNRLEAQLVVLAGDNEELSLTFYDTRYLADRVVYQKDETYQFILRGFAYHFERLPDQSSDLSALVPREDLGADHYEICGPVIDLRAFPSGMLKQKLWLLSVAFAQTIDNEPVKLIICLSEKVLGAKRLPKAGENISAVIWLQGHLWGPVSGL